MNKLFQTKTFSPAQLQGSGLKRTLTAGNLVALGIGAVIGAGIFVITGNAAAVHAGPAVVISFIISAIGCALAGLCYAEFSSMFPVSGSAYSYAYATMGEFVAWILGWDLILEYLLGASTVAVGWSGYTVSFLADLGIHLPTALTQAPIDFTNENGWYLTGAIINFPSVFIVTILATLLVLGVKESATLNNIIVIIKVIVILLFIGFGIAYINLDNWSPFIPENTGHFENFGFSGILSGAAVVFFAYVGFDAVSTAAQEAKNPQKDMPRGILISLLICTILYIAVSLVLTGIVNYKDLNVAAPIALAIDTAGAGLRWLAPLVKIGAIAGLSSVVMVLMYGQSRVFYSMAKDGLLPSLFAKLHHRYRTPHITTWLIGLACAVFAGLLPINILSKMVSIGTLLAFTIVSIGIIILRKRRPDLPRPFKTPWVPVVPIAGALVCLTQMFALSIDTWIRLVGWMAIGLVIYFGYSIRHSKLRKDS
ncbi:MAG: amino acid permease [Dysgonamonadaceae bacterium]|jgi:APA family basic amino acid/polyamine antiporter|nr:amino acid permease [Dysgonamonadaceae bacterium]